MSLKHILVDLATTGGLQVNDATQQAYETYRVNKAANELYHAYDLLNSLRAQYFELTNESGFTVSLPYYVGTIRAVRLAIPNVNLGVVDFRPRFQADMWKPKNFMSWQIKGTYSLAQDITNGSLLTFTFKQPCEKAINITVTGATDYSAQDSETLAFAAGETTKTTTKSFIEVPESITKDVACQYDCDITDVDDEELGTIPNNQLKSEYLWCHVYNPPSVINNFQLASSYVEILWKYRFKPFVNLTDEFMCPNYDDAIIAKRMEHLCSASDDPAVYAKAVGWSKKAGDIVAQRQRDFASQTTDKIVNVAPNAVRQAFENLEAGAYDPYLPSNCLSPR